MGPSESVHSSDGLVVCLAGRSVGRFVVRRVSSAHCASSHYGIAASLVERFRYGDSRTIRLSSRQMGLSLFISETRFSFTTLVRHRSHTVVRLARGASAHLSGRVRPPLYRLPLPISETQSGGPRNHTSDHESPQFFAFESPLGTS